MPPTLGYWKIRGLAQPIRFLLEYTGTAYNEKLYVMGPAPDFDQSEWTKEKFNLGMDFPNLPYYFDGENKITQSRAILKHIARKNNLDGSTECEKIKISMIDGEDNDLITKFYNLTFAPKETFEKNKESYKTDTMMPKLKQFSKFLGDSKWFAGDKLTYVDFLVYELFYMHRELYPGCLDDICNLKCYMTRFESLEPIKKYMSSSRYMKGPINVPLAAFGNQ